MGILTGYTRRTASLASAGGGGGAPNLGTANLTSSDDARTFTLKTGTTATQNFQIKNISSNLIFNPINMPSKKY